MNDIVDLQPTLRGERVILRPGVHHREVAGDAPYVVYEIKDRGSKTSG